MEGCVCAVDINGVWQLYCPLAWKIWPNIDAIGFDLNNISLHQKRCWPVVSEWDQLVVDNHHPKAYLTSIIDLSEEELGQSDPLDVL